MGEYFEEPVLIIKAAQGNRSLGWDILPPGSERFEFEGRTYAGYKDTPDSWVEGQPKKAVNWYAGKQYDDFVRDIHAVLADLPKFHPAYRGQGYEVAGFGWWQGHKDQNGAHAGRYEQNLVRLIEALRAEFAAPKAPFVIATIGFGGAAMKGHGLTVLEAQLAVSGERGNYPQFEGNVKSFDARPFWRDAKVSPNDRQDYHYFHNAETYQLVGQEMGAGHGRAVGDAARRLRAGRGEKEFLGSCAHSSADEARRRAVSTVRRPRQVASFQVLRTVARDVGSRRCCRLRGVSLGHGVTAKPTPSRRPRSDLHPTSEFRARPHRAACRRRGLRTASTARARARHGRVAPA
jgi:hypothetical protein